MLLLLMHEPRAVLGRRLSPFVLRFRGGVYSPDHLFLAAVREGSEDLAVCGVEHLEGPFGGRRPNPLAADQEFSNQHRFGYSAPRKCLPSILALRISV